MRAVVLVLWLNRCRRALWEEPVSTERTCRWHDIVRRLHIADQSLLHLVLNQILSVLCLHPGSTCTARDRESKQCQSHMVYEAKDFGPGSIDG